MLVWLLVLFLLFGFIYVVYRKTFISHKAELKEEEKHHYTFKI